jgi:hypothetical protein
MQLMDFLSQMDRTSVNLEYAKNQLEQARLKFEQAKVEFDETLMLADKFNLSKAKLKKLTDDRIQSLKENMGGLIGVEQAAESSKSAQVKRKKPVVKKIPVKKASESEGGIDTDSQGSVLFEAHEAEAESIDEISIKQSEISEGSNLNH